MRVPVRLTRRGWGFLAAAVGFWLLWIVLQLRDIWYLVAFFGSSLALALFWGLTIPLFAHIRVRLDALAHDPSVGDEVAFVGTISHSLERVLPMELIWDVGGEPYVSALSAPGHHAITSTASVRLGRRGPFKATIAGINIPDPLGLTVRTVRIGVTREILVLPVPLESVPGTSHRRNDRGLRGSASHGALTDSPGTPAGSVRDYRSGDAPRQIHWKQSARQGQLLVNLFEPEHQEDRTLLLVADRACYASTDEFEVAVSATATVALDWIGSGRPLNLQVGELWVPGCRTRLEVLRSLAYAQMIRPSDADESGSRSEPDGVVSGCLTSQLDIRLRSVRFRGILWVIRDEQFLRKQTPWHQYQVPLTRRGSGG
ncbi:DUF58 domain-containing protein [Actinomycetaceae bacterium MB13-C1-2]|nr:DUF58 domain-containing protein [Actinomycetaceae bacterium MB13-C1-2]